MLHNDEMDSLHKAAKWEIVVEETVKELLHQSRANFQHAFSHEKLFNQMIQQNNWWLWLEWFSSQTDGSSVVKLLLQYCGGS